MTDSHWDEVEEAAELLQVGELDAALAELDGVLARNPRNELAHTFRGHVFFEREAFGEALRHYVIALELRPMYLGAMVGAGQCLRYLGDHERALRMAREALKAGPTDPDALFLAACLTYQRGEHYAAAQYLERFLATHPEVEVALEAKQMLRVAKGEASADDDAEAGDEADGDLDDDEDAR